MGRWRSNHTRKTWAVPVSMASGKRTSVTFSKSERARAHDLAKGSSSEPIAQVDRFIKQAALIPEFEDEAQRSKQRGAFTRLVRNRVFKMLQGAYRPDVALEYERAQAEDDFADSPEWRASAEYAYLLRNGLVDEKTGRPKD